jgi:hypothetical protein
MTPSSARLEHLLAKWSESAFPIRIACPRNDRDGPYTDSGSARRVDQGCRSCQTAGATAEGRKAGRRTQKFGADVAGSAERFGWIVLQAAAVFFAGLDCIFAGGFGAAFFFPDLAFSFAANSCFAVAEIASMASGQMMIWVPLLDEHAGFMGPFFITKTVKVVAQIPCNVGETSKPRHSVPDLAPLIVAA